MQERQYSRSVGQLKDYSKCPKAFQFKRIQKAPEAPAAWTARGSAVASALNEWEKSRRTIDIREQYFYFFDQAIDEFKLSHPDLSQWVKTPRVKLTETDIGLRREEGWKHLETYKNRCLAAPWKVYELNGEPAVEVMLESTFDGLKFRGAIDKIIEWPNGKLTIRDEKTGKAENDEFDVRQLGAYKVYCNEILNLPINYAEFWFIKLDRASKMYDLTTFNRAWFIKTFHDLDDLIAQDKFLAVPSKKNCEFCSFRKICQEGSTTL